MITQTKRTAAEILEGISAAYEKKNTRHLLRSKRIIQLRLLIGYWHRYELRQLKASLMNSDNNYREAESFSDLINALFGRDTRPSDFLHDKEELANSCIDLTCELKKSERHMKEAGFDMGTVNAFCKDVEHNDSSFLIKPYGQFALYLLDSLFAYDTNQIGRETFLSNYRLLATHQFAPRNFALMIRRVLSDVERIYGSIKAKQSERRLRKEATR